jgi:ABC-2 type transport system ATP-binding protein
LNPVVRLTDVRKSFDGLRAVDGVSFEVRPGTILGLLGRNGAGKTTTLRVINGILMPDSGSIELFGSADAGQDARDRIGYLPEERGLYKKMKVIDVIVFFAELKGMDRHGARAGALEWLERMDLAKWTNMKVETLSKGMQQKVQFIATVLFQPDMLILDEPHSGLDPVNQEVLRDTIFTARDQGRTVVLSTHNMSQAEAMCEFVCIIAGGRKIVDGRVRDIRRENRGDFYRIEFDGPSAQVDRFMQTSSLFRKRAREGVRWEVELMPGTDSRTVLAEAASLDVPVARFEHVEPSLHEIFVDHVSRVAGNGEVREVARA